jgi:hypothetical protein
MNMTVGSAIRAGISQARRNHWLVWIFFCCAILMAAGLAAPMNVVLKDYVGNATVGRDLVRGFSDSWLTEFQLTRGEFLYSFSITLVFAGIMFLALNTVLAAGAYEVFVRPEDGRMYSFGRGIGRFFFRFARIAVIASVLYFVAFWFWNKPVAWLVERGFRDSPYEAGSFWMTWLRVLLLIVTVLLINIAVEYARADIVLHDHSSALAAFGHGAGFVASHFGRVLAIYLGVGIFTLMAIVLYAIFARYFPQTTVVTILIWFVVAQASLWFRWMFRLASWAAAVDYRRAAITPGSVS